MNYRADPDMFAGETVELTIRRSFSVAPTYVFDAWFDPATLGKWLFATVDGQMKTIEVDARVGGGFRVAEQRGEVLADHAGTYLEIDRPHRLVFSFTYQGEGERTPPSLVILEFAATSTGCELTLTHRMDASFESWLEKVREGWTGVLGGLAANVATERDFVITREVDAPREAVFHAWTKPEQLTRWWGPECFTNPICAIDLTAGGRHYIVMRSPDNIDYPCKGKYLDIFPPKRLVLTMDCSEHPAAWHDMVDPQRGSNPNPAGEIIQSVLLEKLSDMRTRITVRMRFESTAIRDALERIGMREGWLQSFDRLQRALQA
ncbi:MAG: SRPBCC family protein [Rhodocyclaceae bacterium]